MGARFNFWFELCSNGRNKIQLRIQDAGTDLKKAPGQFVPGPFLISDFRFNGSVQISCQDTNRLTFRLIDFFKPGLQKGICHVR